MRSLTASLFTLIAVVAMAVAVPAWWVSDRVVDREGFAKTVSPLADDPEVQEIIAREIASRVVERTGLSKPVVDAAARDYTASPEFPADFRDALTQQHDWLFTEATAEERTQPPSLDITPMARRAIGNAGVAVTLPPGTSLTVPLSDSVRDGFQAGQFHTTGKQITGWSLGLALVALIAAILALVIAPRRFLVVLFLGIGATITGGLVWASSSVVRRAVNNEIEGADASARRVAELLVARLSDDIGSAAIVVALVGLAAIAVGIVGETIASRGRSRRQRAAANQYGYYEPNFGPNGDYR